MVTTQVPVPEQPAPLQPLNLDRLEAGVTLSVTLVFSLNDAEQLVPQLMPAGELVMVPLPVPVLEMLSKCVIGTKFTDAVLFSSIAIVQVLPTTPSQRPPQL
jgi:hypothetical protein